MKINLKTRKILKIASISLTCTLLVVGTCFVTNEKYHWINSLENYFGNLNDHHTSDDVIIESNGIRVRPTSSIVNGDGSTIKTFNYTIVPSDATIKDVLVTAAYKDESSCEAVLDVKVDESKQEITVTCLSDFDQQIIITIKSKEWPDISAIVKIDYQEKVKSITANPNPVEYNMVEEDPSDKELFTWNSTKYSIAKKDYTFTISGGTISNVDTSKLQIDLGPQRTVFGEAFAELTKGCLFNETIVNNYKNTQKVVITTEQHNPSPEQIWNLTNDDTLHKALVQYWEQSLDQDLEQRSYIYYDVNDISAVCSDGKTYTFSITVKASLMYDYSSCYTPITNITTQYPSLVF